MKREYPNRPWVGVGVVVWSGENVLLIRRGGPPRHNQWGLPGGAQALGETLFEAAVREVEEETCLPVTPYAVITAVDGISKDDEGHVLYHYTLVEIAANYDGSLDPTAGDDALDARWVSFEDIATYVEWSETLRIITMSAQQRR